MWKNGGEWVNWGKMRGNGRNGDEGKWGDTKNHQNIRMENEGSTSRVREKWEGGEMEQNTNFAKPHCSHFSGGQTHSPRSPLEKSSRRTHRRKNWTISHSPTLTAARLRATRCSVRTTSVEAVGRLVVWEFLWSLQADQMVRRPAAVL